MDLSTQLTSYFKRYGHIIIPGLGYIQRKYRPPHFDKLNHKVDPPEEKLDFHFDRSLKDEQFAQFLANRNQVSTDRAKKDVEAYVKEDIWGHLNTYRRYRLDHLGDLVKEENGFVRFEALVTDHLAFSNYGLPALKFEEQERRDKKATPIIPAFGCLPYLLWLLIPLLLVTAWLGIDYLYKKSSGEVNNAYVYKWTGKSAQDGGDVYEPSNVSEEADSESKPTIHSKKDDVQKDQGQNTTATQGNNTGTNSKGDQSSSGDNTNTKASANSSGSSGASGLPSKPRQEGGIFYYAVDCSEFIIVGNSFHRRSNARAFCSEMRRQGYPSKIVGRDHTGRYMVSILNFNQANEARSRLASIKNYIAPEAFVMAR